MLVFKRLAEKKILEAIENGELGNLPGQGRPLPGEDLSAIPETRRMAYKILKNAGFTPPELELRKQIHEAATEAETAPEDQHRKRALKRLHCLYSRLDTLGGCSANLALQQDYLDRILARLERP